MSMLISLPSLEEYGELDDSQKIAVGEIMSQSMTTIRKLGVAGNEHLDIGLINLMNNNQLLTSVLTASVLMDLMIECSNRFYERSKNPSILSFLSSMNRYSIDYQIKKLVPHPVTVTKNTYTVVFSRSVDIWFIGCRGARKSNVNLYVPEVSRIDLVSNNFWRCKLAD